MSIQEGVIKYRLHHQKQDIPADIDIGEIEHWRARFHEMGLIAQDPKRYDGHGFGNISQRCPRHDAPLAFLVSGSQTAHLPHMDARGYALVTHFDIEENRLDAIGATPPSSESLTHAVVYQNDATANAVIHVHDPLTWRRADVLGLPITDPKVAYGTVAMANEMKRIMTSGLAPECVMAMGGHEDGIIAWGKDLQSAASVLLRVHDLGKEWLA